MLCFVIVLYNVNFLDWWILYLIKHCMWSAVCESRCEITESSPHPIMLRSPEARCKWGLRRLGRDLQTALLVSNIRCLVKDGGHRSSPLLLFENICILGPRCGHLHPWKSDLYRSGADVVMLRWLFYGGCLVSPIQSPSTTHRAAQHTLCYSACVWECIEMNQFLSEGVATSEVQGEVVGRQCCSISAWLVFETLSCTSLLVWLRLRWDKHKF